MIYALKQFLGDLRLFARIRSVNKQTFQEGQNFKISRVVYRIKEVALLLTRKKLPYC